MANGLMTFGKPLFIQPLDQDSATQKDELGAVQIRFDRTNGGLLGYRYVKLHASSDAGANGTALGFTDVYHTTVSSKFDGGAAVRGAPAGVSNQTLTVSQFGWIQCLGYHSVVINEGTDGTRGDQIILSSTAGKVIREAAGTAPTYPPLGVLVTTATGTTFAVQLRIAF